MLTYPTNVEHYWLAHRRGAVELEVAGQNAPPETHRPSDRNKDGDMCPMSAAAVDTDSRASADRVLDIGPRSRASDADVWLGSPETLAAPRAEPKNVHRICRTIPQLSGID